MRYIREGLYRLGNSVVVFGMVMFCGLVASASMLLKGEEGFRDYLRDKYNDTFPMV